MSEPTIEKSKKQIAEQIATNEVLLSRDRKHLANAIEQALRDRDERAARICDYYREEDGDIASQAASAIRGQ